MLLKPGRGLVSAMFRHYSRPIKSRISGEKVYHENFYNSFHDVMHSQDRETLGHLEIPLENFTIPLVQD